MYKVTRLLFVLLVVLSSASAAQSVDTIPRPLADADVSLRDYVSTQVDQLQSTMNERDRQYAQRFEAQQQALTAALQAAKEGTANALAAAKEAVTKAEEASNKRFDSVNEFRQTLSDQSTTFMGKAEANARLKSLEDDITRISARSEGANNLWVLVAGGILLTLQLGSFVINLIKKKE